MTNYKVNLILFPHTHTHTYIYRITGKKVLYISRHQLTDDNPIKYEVKVTNTGNMGGALAVLAFVTSDVSIDQ